MSYSVSDQAYSAVGRDVIGAQTGLNLGGSPTPISGDATIIEFAAARARFAAHRFQSEDCANNYHHNCPGCACTCHEEAKAA